MDALKKALEKLKQFLIDWMNDAHASPQPVIPEPSQPVIPTTYLWDAPELARHSLRVICDEMGLPYDQKNILCACMQWESGFNPNEVHPNVAYKTDPNGTRTAYVASTDYGICQINDFYHIGPGKDFPSSDYVLNNPEACVRWTVKMWQAGHADWWVSYTSGNYKRFL